MRDENELIIIQPPPEKIRVEKLEGDKKPRRKVMMEFVIIAYEIRAGKARLIDVFTFFYFIN